MSSEKGRNQLVEDYLPLVKATVLRMKHNFPDTYQIDDMYGIGARALVIAVNQFDSSKGKSFGNYAALRIEERCLMNLEDWIIYPVPTGQKQNLFNSQFNLSRTS